MSATSCLQKDLAPIRLRSDHEEYPLSLHLGHCLTDSNIAKPHCLKPRTDLGLEQGPALQSHWR